LLHDAIEDQNVNVRQLRMNSVSPWPISY
jgi:hypothetical protein